MMIRLPGRKVEKMLEVGQSNGMSPQTLYRKAVKVFMASEYYQDLVETHNRVTGSGETNNDQ
jgi:hypothetical protein